MGARADFMSHMAWQQWIAGAMWGCGCGRHIAFVRLVLGPTRPVSFDGLPDLPVSVRCDWQEAGAGGWPVSSGTRRGRR
jgi:hypothetical protein